MLTHVVLAALQDHLCSTVPFADADACFRRSLKIEPRVEASGSNGAAR